MLQRSFHKENKLAQRSTLDPIGLSSDENSSSKPEIKSSRITKVSDRVNIPSTQSGDNQSSGRFNPVFDSGEHEESGALHRKALATVDAHEKYDKHADKLDKIANRPLTRIASKIRGFLGRPDPTKERITALKDKANIHLGNTLTKATSPENTQSLRFKGDALDHYEKAKELNRSELKSIKRRKAGVMPTQFIRRKKLDALDNANVNRLAI